MTWPEYLLAVIAWQSQHDEDDDQQPTEPVSAEEAIRQIRAARGR
ncbi:hypothetical protein [Sphingobium sp. KCTC 72723]|nr:hypothetical protein [Sphingobium sp. KCTC 72723]